MGLLNPKESENGFCASLLNRLFQDHSDHGASKEPKNPMAELREIYMFSSAEILRKRRKIKACYM